MEDISKIRVCPKCKHYYNEKPYKSKVYVGALICPKCADLEKLKLRKKGDKND